MSSAKNTFRNSKNGGVISTSMSIRPKRRTLINSMTGGTSSISASMIAFTMTTTAATRVPISAAKAATNPTTTPTIPATIIGIMPIMVVIIITRFRRNASMPAVPIAKPSEMALTSVPIPMPRSATAAPRASIAPARINNPGATASAISAAPKNISNVPPRTESDLAMASQLNAENRANTGRSVANATERSVTAAARANSPGQTTCATAAAAKNISSEPPIAARPLAIASHSSLENTKNGGMSTFIAAAITRSDAAPASPPPASACMPIENPMMAANKTTIAAPAFPRDSQSISPNTLATVESCFRAAATRSSPMPCAMRFPPSLLIPIENPITAANSTVIAAPAFPKDSQSIDAKSLATEANIFKAAAMAITPTPVLIIPFGDPSFVTPIVKPIKAARSTVIAEPAFPKSSHDIDAKSLDTEANILMAAATAIRPTPALIMPDPWPTSPISIVIPVNAVNNAPMAVPALRRSSHDISAKVLATDARIATAAATAISPTPVEIRLLLFANFVTSVSSASKTPIATTPFTSSSTLREAIFFIAEARIRTLTDIATIPSVAFNRPLLSANLIAASVEIALETCVNRMLIAPTAIISCVVGISEIVLTAMARIRMAAATLMMLPMLIDCLRVLEKSTNASLIPPRKLLKPSLEPEASPPLPNIPRTPLSLSNIAQIPTAPAPVATEPNSCPRSNFPRDSPTPLIHSQTLAPAPFTQFQTLWRPEIMFSRLILDARFLAPSTTFVNKDPTPSTTGPMASLIPTNMFLRVSQIEKSLLPVSLETRSTT